MELSVPERQLVAFASEQFGEPLCQFLLAGLGEEEVAPRWRFTITYVDEEGKRLKRQVQVISHEPEDGSSCLPRGRDPLVLLALLRLLLQNDQANDCVLLYDQEDVLKLLGWEGTPENRGEIDEAARRYFLLFFKWGLNKTELARRKLSSYNAMESIISERGTLDREEEGRVRRVFNRVTFNDIFIRHLKRRRLFDIDWSSSRKMTGALTSGK
jgi:hypothetical protein